MEDKDYNLLRDYFKVNKKCFFNINRKVNDTDTYIFSFNSYKCEIKIKLSDLFNIPTCKNNRNRFKTISISKNILTMHKYLLLVLFYSFFLKYTFIIYFTFLYSKCILLLVLL